MIDAGVLGIIFSNMHDSNVQDLVVGRTMGSLPFGGRYRMIDFCLSGMAGAGIQNIAVVTHKNYHSLMDHLGNGREWDLSSKRGGLVLFPPYARDGSKLYASRIEALATVLEYLEQQKEELVVMSDCDIAFNLDYRDLLSQHRSSGALVSLVYEKAVLPENLQKDNYTLRLDADGLVQEIRVNEYKKGIHNVAMNVMVIDRQYLAGAIREATVRGATNFARDFLAKNLQVMAARGYEYTGYSARIFDMQSYFAENLRLLSPENLNRLFVPGRPIYTKVRDEAPVRYAIGSCTENSLVADGCIVEGKVENCVLFRGVRVGKNSHLKNCVVMQGTEIESEVVLENVITDKDVTICAGQRLCGASSFPLFIAKGTVVR